MKASNALCDFLVADKLSEQLSCGRINKESEISEPVDFRPGLNLKKSGTHVESFNAGELGTPLMPIPHDDEESNISTSQV